MNSPRCFFAALLFAAFLLTPAAPAQTPPLPDTPAPVRELLLARPFSLENGFTYAWSAQRPLVTEGLILVLTADPEYLRPRETQEPVLFVGPYPAQRLSWNLETGRLVVLVPAKVDLSVEPVWFGTPGLPEAVDARTVAAERGLALSRGIRAADPQAVRRALSRGGDEVRYPSRIELLQAAAAL